MKFELHPLCALFPRMSGAEYEALKEDIRVNGLRHPIITHQGMVLDGGNRYQACMDLGIKPLMTEYSGENLVTYVLSANFFRRHLSPGQQAAIVASAQDWAGAQTVGKPKSCNVAPLATAADRAAQSGASVRTQKMADAVAKRAPDLAVQVAHGDISLPAAVKQISEPKVKAQEPPQDDGPDDAEIAAGESAARADAEAMQKLLDSDDTLSTAYAEIKRLNAELAVVKMARDGYMNKVNEQIKIIKRLQSKVDKLERAPA